jgi:hypothetical protein
MTVAGRYGERLVGSPVSELLPERRMSAAILDYSRWLMLRRPNRSETVKCWSKFLSPSPREPIPAVPSRRLAKGTLERF